jgi:hypothetical protein
MTMLQDFRYALRTIGQAPGFSVVVTLTIALGVGATTAIFSVVDAVLLRPLPYPAQGSLVKLFDIQSGRDVGALSYPEFIDWRDRGSDVLAELRHAHHHTDVACSGRSGEADSGGRCRSRCGAPGHRRQVSRGDHRRERAPAATDKQA